MVAYDEYYTLLQRIITPLDGDLPSGIDLREDMSPRAIYSRLRDARAAARSDERSADDNPSEGGGIPSAWIMVETLATEALCEHSKDLEIASWLTESLTRRHGLAGLATGAGAMAGLIDGFWNMGMFPSEEPDDPDARLFAVTGLSGSDRPGSLLQPLRKVVLFLREDGSPVPVWQYERSREISALGNQASKLKQGADVPAFDTLETVAKSLGRQQLLATGLATRAAQAAWHDLEQALLRNVPAGHALSTSRVTELLASIEQIVLRYLSATDLMPQAVVTPDTSAADTEIVVVSAETAEPAVQARSSQPASREELLDELLRIGNLFREREPNSSLGYTLEEAVRRARLPLLDLLKELIPDLPPRSHVLTALGIRPPAE